MKGSENFGGISNYFKHERKTQKFLFAEELAAYRAIRTESKAHTLLKAVCSIVLHIIKAQRDLLSGGRTLISLIPFLGFLIYNDKNAC